MDLADPKVNGREAAPAFPRDPRQAAELYLERDLAPIRLPFKSKSPGRDGWQNERLAVNALDSHFPPGSPRNIGILNGAPSNNLHDVDLDVAEAVRAADRLLQATSMESGRPSAPRSHRWYKTETALDSSAETFKDYDGTMLVELRGTGSQTVVPPSVHEGTGEPIVWAKFGEPAHVRLEDLLQGVRKVAAATIIARHWPAPGSRDEAAMALTGALTRAGWKAERIGNFVKAVAAAAGDEEIKMRASKADATARKLDEGKHVTGWPRLTELLGADGEAVVERVRNWLGLTTSAEVADPPVPEPPPWPKPPGTEAFHGLPGKFVRAVEPATEADPAALLVQFLVAFGNVIGRLAYFQVEADRHHANEFVAIVGRTSKARKGTSWGRVIQPLREADDAWAKNCVQSGLSSGEGVIWAVRDRITKQEKIKERNKPVRYEEVEVDPGVEDKRLLVVEPELANVLKQTERQGNTLSVILRQAWDGLDLRTMTKNSPARATGAHVSVVGHITADELRRYLTQTEMANGFGNRFLWLCAERSKLLPEGGSVDKQAWADVGTDLAQAIAFARSAGEVKRDDAARSIWKAVYGELSDGKPGLAGAMLARSEAHVMRLAMLYALMDSSNVIKAPHMMAALALWDYCERSVLHVFGDLLGDPVADDLLRLLRSCPSGLTRTQIRDYFQRNIPQERLVRALGLLLQHRLARCDREQPRDEQGNPSGRPAERWHATGVGKGQ
jgi:hypothetical protein